MSGQHQSVQWKSLVCCPRLRQGLVDLGFRRLQFGHKIRSIEDDGILGVPKLSVNHELECSWDGIRG